MSLPKKQLFDPQSKTANPHQSDNHPLAGSAAASNRTVVTSTPETPSTSAWWVLAAASLQKVAKPIRVGPGQTRANLMRSDLDEYARSHAGGAAGANPGPGLLQKVSDEFKRLLKKRVLSAELRNR